MASQSHHPGSNLQPARPQSNAELPETSHMCKDVQSDFGCVKKQNGPSL